jgi:hypothetical protein
VLNIEAAVAVVTQAVAAAVVQVVAVLPIIVVAVAHVLILVAVAGHILPLSVRVIIQGRPSQMAAMQLLTVGTKGHIVATPVLTVVVQVLTAATIIPITELTPVHGVIPVTAVTPVHVVM